MIDEIVDDPQSEKIDDLLALMQSWFALEWHGLRNEGRKGNLTDIEKDELRNKFWKEYKNRNMNMNNTIQETQAINKKKCFYYKGLASIPIGVIVVSIGIGLLTKQWHEQWYHIAIIGFGAKFGASPATHTGIFYQ